MLSIVIVDYEEENSGGVIVVRECARKQSQGDTNFISNVVGNYTRKIYRCPIYPTRTTSLMPRWWQNGFSRYQNIKCFSRESILSLHVIQILSFYSSFYCSPPYFHYSSFSLLYFFYNNNNNCES